MTTQVFVASSAFGLITLSAALAAGSWGPADRRVLVVTSNAIVPETAPPLTATPGLSALLAAFDLVADYNEAIAPQHPSVWRPRAADLPIVERYLRQRWGLGEDELTLVVESIQVAPALALCQVFPDARIDVYADGLMSYGPTRNPLPPTVGTRVERLLHLDLVPGLRPVLLREFGVPATVISTQAFRDSVRRVGAGADAPPALPQGGRVAVVLGQYLADLGVLSQDEELQLQTAMVEHCLEQGFDTVVFKPHPSAPRRQTGPLIEAAARRGARLVVRDEPSVVETWFGREPVHLVVGCFSTGLLTAAMFDVPAARLGTELLLERLRPYENSNRIPVTLVHACVPAMTEAGPLTRRPEIGLPELVETVSYCMQPRQYPELRTVAARVLTTSWDEARPYVKRRRLTSLALPGALPEKSAARRTWARYAKRLASATLGPTTTQRIGHLSSRRTRTRRNGSDHRSMGQT
jgi:Alpha-2,8-polysialyltransferase (POLYST)